MCPREGKGWRKYGYAADFVVLNEDILTIDPNQIGDILVEETYMAGESVYRRKIESLL
ncbi:amidohydrolase family protein [Chungangia koreensis]|uniref:Amidohydrolase family protein n=1 Tax=Chungangia koreensis TaxID=752657 RepID=A0ABV8X1V8_9LACT